MLIELLAIGGAVTAGRAAWRRRRSTRHAPKVQLPDAGPTEMRWIDGDLVTGTTGLALAGASLALKSSGLGLASAPLIAWSSRGLLDEARQNVAHDRRLGFAGVDAGLTVVGLLTGAYVMAAGGTLIYVGWRKLADWQRVQANRARDAVGPAPAGAATWFADGDVQIGVPAQRAEIGDRICIRSGEWVPADARITAGRARVASDGGQLGSRALGPGSGVAAGDRVISGEIEVRVGATGLATNDGRWRAAPNSSPVDLETIAERTARVADASAGFSMLTGVLGALFIGGQAALAATAANLLGAQRVISPAALENHLRVLHALGFHIDDGRRFELLAGASAVVVDLSTLLDRDRLTVSAVRAADGFDGGESLRWAAGLMSGSDEAAAVALIDATLLRGAVPHDPPATPRGGIYRGQIDGHRVVVGAIEALTAEGVAPDTGLRTVRRAARARGESTLAVAIDSVEAAVICLEPSIRPGADRLFPALRSRGIQPTLLVADGESVAEHWSARLHIQRFIADQDPDAMADIVRTLRIGGQMVIAVGDATRHRPMMGAADISIALGNEPGVVRGAGLALCGRPIDTLPAVIDLARRYHRGQGQAIALATAATGLLGFGVLAFGLGPIAALGAQVAGGAASVVLTLPDVEPLAVETPPIPTTRPDPAAEPGPGWHLSPRVQRG